MEPKFLIIDLFCGAGGVTTGFVQAQKEGASIAKVIACVNHDAKAIESHWKNHPDVVHFEEDIKTLKLHPLVDVANINKRSFPDAKMILWASLECTNFSKAKGGLPRDADSRTLADHLHRYIEALSPDAVMIENVVEFMSWGPLDDNGRPVSKKSGLDFLRWRGEMCAHGYADEWKEMNSADYGAYTSRNRLFGIFAKPDFPICWPDPTHSKTPGKASLFGSLEKWKPVKDVLDFTDEGESIFNRKKPLSDKTLERIYAGLIKFVAKGDRSFIQKYFSGRPAGKVNSVNVPAGVITTMQNMTLVQCNFIVQRNSGDVERKLVDLKGPARTVTTTGGNQDLVQPSFLAAYYGNGDNVSSVENPCPTVPTKDRFQVVQPEPFIQRNFSGGGQLMSVEEPAGSVLPVPKQNLVTSIPFIVNPAWGGNPGDVNQPCCVIVARQDKAPLSLVQVEGGSVTVPIYEDDTDIMVKIKQFMAVYQLVDIKMRMLRVPELLKIQGFPDEYVLAGNQTDQKKFIGNSVVPHVVKAWAESLADKLNESKVKVA